MTQFWLAANRAIRDSGTYNALDCRIKVPTSWNVELFCELLNGYYNAKIVDFIEFGWPLDPAVGPLQVDKPQNQREACDNPKKVEGVHPI